MSVNSVNGIFKPIQAMELKFDNKESPAQVETPTFLDIFTNIVQEAQETQAVKAQDMLDLMLGDVDDLERVQTNIAKADLALELMVNVKNTAVEAYNEIIKMNI